jgi:hypothetical protein
MMTVQGDESTASCFRRFTHGEKTLNSYLRVPWWHPEPVWTLLREEKSLSVIAYPINTALAMILYLFIYHIYYYMFRPLITAIIGC